MRSFLSSALLATLVAGCAAPQFTVIVKPFTGHLPVWREMNEREVRWFAPGDAALLVEEPGLSALLEQVASPA